MNRTLFYSIASAFLICVNPAAASIITFDDAYAIVSDAGNVSTFYQSSLGVTISGDNAGVWGGVGHGDPGFWGLLGTNGSAFLGANDGTDSNPTFNFSVPISGISLDIGDSFETGTFTVTGFLGGTQVASQTITITNPNTSVGTWQTVTLTGSLDQVEVTAAGPAPFFGIDNVVTSSAPEPSTFGLLGGSLAFAAWIRRSRRSKKA